MRSVEPPRAAAQVRQRTTCANTLTWVKCGLNYCVPFVVSNLGLLAGKQAEEERRAALRVVKC
jgi:hypothetical protein